MEDTELRDHDHHSAIEAKFACDQSVKVKGDTKGHGYWHVIGLWWSDPHGSFVYNLRHDDASERVVVENEIYDQLNLKTLG